MTIHGADLAKRGERIAEARNDTKADVWLVRDERGTFVVKTLDSRPIGSGRLLAKMLLRREGQILADLRGTPGVPSLVEATDTSLVVEWRPGRTLFDLRKRGISAQTGEAIAAVLAGIHGRRFAHGDIGRRDVLVAGDGTVSLLDFATAVGPGSPRLVWRILLPIWKRRDAAQVAKLIRRYRRQWEKREAARDAKAAHLRRTE